MMTNTKNEHPIIDNRYELLNKLGEGGMGAVYRATDHLTGQIVALKQVELSEIPKTNEKDGYTSEQLLQSLAREFQMLASLKHPHVISVLDYGFHDERHPYFTMALLKNVKTIIAAAKSLSLEGKVDLLIQFLQSLTYLHRRGIIHRDLKPGNVLVENNETVHVLDFGLSTLSEQQPDPDAKSKVHGTLTYVAPELLRKGKATPQSDLYAVGVIAYEVFSGEYPFEVYRDDPQRVAKLMRHILVDPPDLEKLVHQLNKSTHELPVQSIDEAKTSAIKKKSTDENTGVIDEKLILEQYQRDPESLKPTKPMTRNEEIAAIVGRLMEKEPHKRYQDAYTVIQDLSRVIGKPTYQESIEVRESFLQAATFVGREKELNILKEAMIQASMGKGSAWLVGGESGVGKSRLLDELRIRAIGQGAKVVRAQAIAESSAPYQLWRDPLRRLVLSTQVTDTEAAILKEVVPDISTLLARPIPDAPVLEGKGRQQRLISTMVDLFRKQKQPIVLLLEDLQWADTSLFPLEQLIQNGKDMRLLIVGNYRYDETPDLPSRLVGANHIKLERLTKENIAALSMSMLGEAGNQPQILEFLQQETEGNVFFMVETVRALAEEAGRLQSVTTMELPAKVFPGGVKQIIQRRLDMVPQHYHPMLKIAAVAGRQVDLRIMEKLSQSLDIDSWVAACANVAVFDRQDEQWRFAHDKLREALLTDLNDQDQQNLHQEVAEAIETVYPDDHTHAATLMEHWHYAKNPSKELQYAFIAGEQASAVSNFKEAINLFNRSLDLITDATSQTHASLLIHLGNAYEGLSAHATARTHLEKGLDLARQLNLQSMQVEALNGLGWVAERQGSYNEAQQLASQALEIARNLHNEAGIAQALKNLGNIHRLRGNLDEATKYYHDSIEIRTKLNDQEGIGVCLNNLGLTVYLQGNVDIATNYLDQSVKIYEQIGDRLRLADSLGNLGVMMLIKGDIETATEYFERTLQISREIGDRGGQAVKLTNLGMLKKEQENYGEAHQYFDQSLTICREIGDLSGIANSLINLGVVAKLQQNFVESTRHFQEALREAQRLGSEPVILEVIVEFAGLQAHTGHVQQAAQWLGMVSSHPAVNKTVQSAIDTVGKTIDETLSVEEKEKAFEQGKNLTLEIVLKSIL